MQRDTRFDDSRIQCEPVTGSFRGSAAKCREVEIKDFMHRLRCEINELEEPIEILADRLSLVLSADDAKAEGEPWPSSITPLGEDILLLAVKIKKYNRRLRDLLARLEL